MFSAEAAAHNQADMCEALISNGADFSILTTDQKLAIDLTTDHLIVRKLYGTTNSIIRSHV